MTMEHVYKSFFEALNHGGTEPIIQTAYNLLGYPIILNDNSGNTLMQIPNTTLDDPDWDYSFDHKTIQREHYLNLYHNFISKTDLHNRPVYVKEGFLEERYQIIVVASYRQEILGLVSIIVNSDNLPPEELEIIQIFIDAIRSELKRNHLNIQRERTKLATVILEKDVTSTTYQLSISSLGKLYAGSYQIVIAKPRITKDIPLLDVVSKDLNKNCPSTISTVVEDCLVVLLYRVTDKMNAYEKPLQILDSYPFYCAVSTVFENIEDLKDFYFQASMTLKCGINLHPHTRTYYFHEYVPYQTIAAAAEHAPIITFLDPLVKTIADFDQENSTEYLSTLNAYLYCRQNKTETIRHLFIHQNTLTYRLKRMEELFQLDFEDGIRLQNLYGSVMLWNFLRGDAPEFGK